MFSTERSDFAVPVTGYLLMAVLLVVEALGFLYSGDWLNKCYADAGLLTVLSVILIIVGLVSLWKAYIVDGVSFLLFGALAYITADSLSGSVAFIIGIVFILVAAMAFRAGDMLVLVNDALIAVGLILIGIFAYHTDVGALALVSSIFVILAAAASLFICYNDWSLVQDISADYEESLLEGDDCCCCDDDCDCCGDDCDCGCHDKKE